MTKKTILKVTAGGDREFAEEVRQEAKAVKGGMGPCPLPTRATAADPTSANSLPFLAQQHLSPNVDVT